MTQRLAKHVLQSVPIIFCAPKSSSPVMWSNYSGPTGSSPSHLSSGSCIRSARFFWHLSSLQLWRSVLTLARASARKNLLAFDSHVGPEDPDSPRLLSHSNPKQWNKYLIFQKKERNISVWPLSWPSVRTTTAPNGIWATLLREREHSVVPELFPFRLRTLPLYLSLSYQWSGVK